MMFVDLCCRGYRWILPFVSGILLRNVISLSFFVREVLDVGWLVIQKLIARLLFFVSFERGNKNWAVCVIVALSYPVSEQN